VLFDRLDTVTEKLGDVIRACPAGEHIDGKAKIQVQEEQAKRTYVDPGHIAEKYAFLGERDKAFELL